jgi:very-short-patch-repair endonuclease
MQLERRVRDGSLERVRSSVYRFAGTPPTWEQAVLAACLSAHGGAVASHTTAARLFALRGFEETSNVEITTASRQRTRLTEVVVHDTMFLGRHHVTRRRSMPVTSPARTVCDLTWRCAPWQVERALDDALRRGLTSLRRIDRVFRDLAHRGRRRSTVMRGLLEARLPGFDPGDSDMELRLVRWLSAAGLTPPVQQHRVRVGGTTYRLDLAYPELKIGIEYDGWDPHRTRSAFDGDRRRQNPLELRGWLMLRYTSASTRELVVAEISEALALRTSASPFP